MLRMRRKEGQLPALERKMEADAGGSGPFSRLYQSQFTPVSSRRTPAQKRRRLCGADVAEQVAADMVNRYSSPHFSTPQGTHTAPTAATGAFRPNQVLYDGPYQNQSKKIASLNSHLNYRIIMAMLSANIKNQDDQLLLNLLELCRNSKAYSSN